MNNNKLQPALSRSTAHNQSTRTLSADQKRATHVPRRGKLSPEIVRQIRAEWAETPQANAERFGKKYGVSLSTIKAVVNGKTWKEAIQPSPQQEAVQQGREIAAVTLHKVLPVPAGLPNPASGAIGSNASSSYSPRSSPRSKTSQPPSPPAHVRSSGPTIRGKPAPQVSRNRIVKGELFADIIEDRREAQPIFFLVVQRHGSPEVLFVAQFRSQAAAESAACDFIADHGRKAPDAA